MAVVATRRRDNDGRFAPSTNCHPNPPWFAGRRERLRCRPERALDEVAASELLPRRSIARFARIPYLPRPTWNRQGQTKNCCGGGAVECAARAEPRSGDASSSNRNVKLSFTRAAKWQLGHRMARRCRRRIGRGQPCRASARWCGSGRWRWHASGGGGHGL